MLPYPHQTRSLKTRISLFTLLIFSVSLWSLTLYASQMLRHDMQRQLSDQQFSVVHFLAGAIDAHLNERVRALELVVAALRRRCWASPMNCTACSTACRCCKPCSAAVAYW